MDQANQGYTLFPSKGMIFKHCGEDCKVVTDNVPHFEVKVLPILPLGCEEKNLILLSSEGCLPSILSTYTVVQVTVCMSIESASVTYKRPIAVVQLRTTEQHVFFSAYLADDFSPTEPVHEFPPGFSFDLLKDNDIISRVLKMPLQNKGISSISHLLVKATEADASLAKYFCITLGPCDKYVYLLNYHGLVVLVIYYTVAIFFQVVL